MKRIAVLLVLGLLAGCSGATTSGSPTTAPTTEAEPTSSSASGLSIDKFVSKPCDILTTAQVTKLGDVKAPETSTSTLGPQCKWAGQDIMKNSTYWISVTQDKDLQGMVDNIKANPIHTDHVVDGVRLITNDGTDGSISCRTIIEVSGTDSITVSVSIAADERAAKKPCTESETVAKMVIANLRA